MHPCGCNPNALPQAKGRAHAQHRKEHCGKPLTCLACIAATFPDLQMCVHSHPASLDCCASSWQLSFEADLCLRVALLVAECSLPRRMLHAGEGHAQQQRQPLYGRPTHLLKPKTRISAQAMLVCSTRQKTTCRHHKCAVFNTPADHADLHALSVKQH